MRSPDGHSSPGTSTGFEFGNFELQLGERRLLAGGAAVGGLGPRGFDVLALLLERAGHLVTKDELFARVWSRAVVDDSALQFQISALRKLVGAAAIVTVSGRGYRFVLPVARRDHVAVATHNLPQAATSFVGRERDLEQLRKLLDRGRLVTLTGAGGCGKTRLAIEVAARAVQRHVDGVWIVELAALADGSHLPRALMSALGVKEVASATPLDALIAHLGSKRMLLLLDNAEHLLSACAELVDRLLQLCPGVSVMVTSRQAMGVVGEQTYRVPSLSVPDVQRRIEPERLLEHASVLLFVQRTRLLSPHFTVTAQNASAVALLCWRLDGIPLAIELAAGRMRSMSLDELSQRLNQRFSLLNGGAPGALPRHRTLRSLIDWSYDLLGPPEQALLCRLSVFAGGCSLQSAEAVCCEEGADGAGVMDLLTALADKSLVVMEESDSGTRYRLLETVRQYARERLRDSGDEARWQTRHQVHFMALLKSGQPLLHGPGQQAWFDRYEVEKDNLRAALSWSMAMDETCDLAFHFAGALHRYWTVRGYLAEGRAWYADILAKVPAGHPSRERAIGLSLYASFASAQGDIAAAQALEEEALQEHRKRGDRVRTAGTLNNLAEMAQSQGRLGDARRQYEEAVSLLRAGGPDFKLAAVLGNLANTAIRELRFAEAQDLLHEALAKARHQGDGQCIGFVLGSLGTVAVLEGRNDEARRLLCESLALLGNLGDRQQALLPLVEMAHLDACLAALARAARLWGAAEQWGADLGCRMPPALVSTYTQRVAAARAAWADDQAFDEAWQQGRALTLAQAVALALEAPKS